MAVKKTKTKLYLDAYFDSIQIYDAVTLTGNAVVGGQIRVDDEYAAEQPEVIGRFSTRHRL